MKLSKEVVLYPISSDNAPFIGVPVLFTVFEK